MSRNPEDRRPKAETEFDAYLRLVEAGDSPNFEAYCGDRPDLADALKFLYSLHFQDRGAEAETRESLGVSLLPSGEEASASSSDERPVRYCTGCGRPIGSEPVCSDPACATPNFLRDVAPPERFARSAARASDETASAEEAGPVRDQPTEADPAFAVLRAISSPAIEYLLYPGVTKVGAGDSADIVIDRPEVSARHARIECWPDESDSLEVILTDRGSTNGTYVSGERIRSRTLVDGDRIQFGSVECEIRLLSGDERRVTMKIDRSP